MTGERILIVAPSWVGDAILSEPLVALLREPYEDPVVDVLVNAWCAPVYARMRGIRRIIENPIGHGRLDLAGRRRLGRELAQEGYSHAFVLPNSWKSALVPFLASMRKRVGYVGEFRYGLLTDARRLNPKAMPRLVDRFAALALPRGGLVPMPPSPVLVPDAANRAAAMRALRLKTDRPVVILCPGAEFGAAKRWPPNHFAELAGMLLRAGLQVWIVGSPNDKIAADAVVNSLDREAPHVRDLSGRTDLGTAIDLLSIASLVVSNDSGPDARGGRGRRAAGRAVRLVVAGVHAADFRAGADRPHRHRLQPLLQAGMPARPLPLHARAAAGDGLQSRVRALPGLIPPMSRRN